MAWKIRRFQCLMWCVSLCLLCGFYLVALMSMTTPAGNCNCNAPPGSSDVKDAYISHNSNDNPVAIDTVGVNSQHHLGVLVPYRHRFEELLVFAPYIHSFLNRQGIKHTLYVMNQVDQFRFNRASLINIGFIEARNSCDYIAMHDVDLLPMNPALSYGYPEKQPFHIAAPGLHPRYNYSTFVGGILLLKSEHFSLVDGMSNKYWGWGLEDDEFYVRLKSAGLNVSRPINITTGRNTFKHIHNRKFRHRDVAKCYSQREATRRRDKKTGLHNVQYRITDRKSLLIDGAPVTLLNVQLHCDRNISPWCDCSGDKGGQSSGGQVATTTVKPKISSEVKSNKV